MKDNFLAVTLGLIDDLKEYKHEYTPSEYKRILELRKIAKENKKEFIRRYKKLSGANDWDLPDIIFSES